MSTLHTLDLRAYLDSLPRGGVSAFAARLGVHAVYLSQLAARRDLRVPSAELCVAIEVASNGVVTRRTLRPSDWWRIWPELVTEEFPAPAADVRDAA